MSRCNNKRGGKNKEIKVYRKDITIDVIFYIKINEIFEKDSDI